MRLALIHEIISPGKRIFDYGCGRGDDLRHLAALGHDAAGWDPNHRPDDPKRRSDIVSLNYVLNVIEDPIERARTLSEAWSLCTGVLIVAARLVDEQDDAHVAALGDGFLTRHGTFQRFFQHPELGSWIEEQLDAAPVAAGPGIYYVFRRSSDRETYLASRFRRPVSLPRRRPSDEEYSRHRELLEPLIAFVAERGRLPAADELANTSDLIAEVGSIRRAFRLVLHVTSNEDWDRLRQQRSVDLLVHLALGQFHGRARLSELPQPMQRDLRAFFPTYKAACTQADKLLFATGNPDAIALTMRASQVGKMTGNGLYAHESALALLPALLRVYEGCARAYIGTADGANVIKLARPGPQVSYLTYPSFESDPHPILASSLVVSLNELRVHRRSYDRRANPPILHRKEDLVGPDHACRGKFARLTASEERHGLYLSPALIGTVDGWTTALAAAGFALRGHRLIRRR